ncbi:hypothetical protein B9Z55_012442 [Caenorhabditis nigoni]|uniref:Uncharacterized protein n=1 Tax=Caenorhabditis nigoni TaxID=1611254 RepID=A0A2G5TX69_9PELO|nr:hypothetical protein B9Z55_012442 [Caenorhabditis nigoni]
MDHDGCPVLKQFEVYARLSRNYVTSLSHSTCITPETIPELVNICNRRPRPPSDHVESPCNKYSDRCLTEELINQGCYQLANMHVVLTIAQERCKVIEKNREQWSHYFNLINMKIEFPA